MSLIDHTFANFPRILILICTSFILSSYCCEGPVKEYHLFNQIEIVDSLSRKNDSVNLNLEIKIPPKYKIVNTIIEYTPIIISKSLDSLEFRTQKFQGEKVTESYVIVPYNNGRIIEYSDKIPIVTKSEFEYLILKVKFICAKKNQTALTNNVIIRKYDH